MPSIAFTIPAILTTDFLRERIGTKNDDDGVGLSVERYMRLEDGKFHSGVLTATLSNEDGDLRTLGFFQGYAGGGVFEDGFFVIDMGDEEPFDVINLGEPQELKSLSAQESHLCLLLQKLAQELWSIDDNQEAVTVTPHGQELLEELGEEDEDSVVFMDDTFDGDSLADVSQAWSITLRFEN